MTRISSAAYVTAVLNLLHAYNNGDLDACERLFDQGVVWHDASVYRGPAEARSMLEHLSWRFSQPRVRPDDFREAGGHVLMVVSFVEGDPEAAPLEERQSWVVDLNDDGLIARVMTYAKPAEAARALEAIAPRVHA